MEVQIFIWVLVAIAAGFCTLWVRAKNELSKTQEAFKELLRIYKQVSGVDYEDKP
jgi:hypothetical protein